VTGTDWIGSFKSNYSINTIMTTTAQKIKVIKIGGDVDWQYTR
jgi:hypothetical protein